MQRTLLHTVQGRRATDGAGVSLVRVLGHATTRRYDPVLMLDSFDSIEPADYRAGFPTHPHRGIETFSFIAQGAMLHRDTLGNEALIGDGEAQFLSAGSGVLHSEMLPERPRLLGLQLWLNLPAKDKMCTPSYRSIKREDIPEVGLGDARLRVVAGRYGSAVGFQTPHLPLDYFDIHLPAGESITLTLPEDQTGLLFTLLGEVSVADALLPEKTAAQLSEGTELTLTAGTTDVEIVYIGSQRLEEPIAWYGPIVMNTEEEIDTAIRALNAGTFLKERTAYD